MIALFISITFTAIFISTKFCLSSGNFSAESSSTNSPHLNEKKTTISPDLSLTRYTLVSPFKSSSHASFFIYLSSVLFCFFEMNPFSISLFSLLNVNTSYLRSLKYFRFSSILIVIPPVQLPIFYS